MEETNSLQNEEKIVKIEIEPKINSEKKFSKKKIFVGFGVLILLLFLLVSIPGFIAFGRAKKVYQEGMQLKEVAKSKDLKLINEKLAQVETSLADLEKSLVFLSWVKFVPFVGAYEADIEHFVKAGKAGLEAGATVLKAVEPYSDIMGFSGGTTTADGEKTAQDRIAFVVTTIDKIGPDLGKIGEKMTVAKKEVDEINPDRYPEQFQGKKIRQPLTEAIALIDQVATVTTEAKPLFEVAPWLLGLDAPRKYFILFQNDAELRPTGGFMTAYALLEIDKGKIKPLLSEDIYSLDARFRKKIPAPEPIKKYLANVPYFNLRDMNLSPDFAVSMQTFLENYKETKGPQFDGIIAVDTKFLVKLLEVLGQIGVSGWGNFSAEPDQRCDGCPQVVYELERLADKPLSTLNTARKAVIGPLMHSTLANAMGSPKEKIPGLFNAFFSSLLEKHVLFYFTDAKIQAAVESFNIAGRIKDYEGDYFHLNDSSFSGAKTNLFLKQTVEQKIEIKNGLVTKTVTIEYKNPSPASNCNLEAGQLCLNAPYRDWFRLYVPKGAKLLESSGSEVEIKTYEDLGKTVFEGFFGDKYPLRPQGSAKLTFKYEFPLASKEEYKLLIQKQPGTAGFMYTVSFGNQKEEFELKTDRELRFKL